MKRINHILILFLTFVCLTFPGCEKSPVQEGNTIILVPIYGQSLALGEEAKLVTNFDSLKINSNHKIVTENLDENFGFFSNTLFKQKIKKLINDTRRTFEISAYGLGEFTCRRWNNNHCKDSVICVFSEGQGATGIDYLGQDSRPYKKLLTEIKNVYDKAVSKHCHLIVPAFCWMQGEDDVVHNTGQEYKKKLILFRKTIEKDVQKITHQQQDVKCILYQTNCLSIAKDTFNSKKYNCIQTRVPQEQMELVRDNNDFSASGPTYPYSIVREYAHIDGISQKRMGYLEGFSLEKILKGKKNQGVIPQQLTLNGNTVIISFYIQSPPLVFDTIQVIQPGNYGFSVITPMNQDILKKVVLKDNQIHLICSVSPQGAKIRYAVNGNYWKSGCKNGPRGNLRDSQGDFLSIVMNGKTYRIDNWCYMFDMVCK